MNLLKQLWDDESGFVLSAEAALLGTIGVVGATVGLGAAAKSVNDELTEAAYAFRSLDQSYCIAGTYGCGACTASSCFTQQDVEVSRAELSDWIEAQREGGTAVDDTTDNVAPPMPTEDTTETEKRERMQKRRLEHEGKRKKNAEDRAKKKKRKQQEAS